MELVGWKKDHITARKVMLGFSASHRNRTAVRIHDFPEIVAFARILIVFAVFKIVDRYKVVDLNILSDRVANIEIGLHETFLRSERNDKYNITYSIQKNLPLTYTDYNEKRRCHREIQLVAET